MICTDCKIEVKTKLTKTMEERLPKSWKRKNNQVFCGKCWNKQYGLRAVVFPIASPIEPLTWLDLRKLVSGAWQQSTSLSNWLSTELRRHDVVRTHHLTKLPKYKVPYLYKEAREFLPEMNPASLVAVMHAVSRKYSAKRFEVVWTGASSLPTFRYPVPYPIRADDWSPRWLSETEQAPVVSVKIGAVRFEVRLRGGVGFRRQHAAFVKLMKGLAIPAEASIYRCRAHLTDHRNGVEHRDDGGQKVFSNLMLKLVLWMPKEEKAVNADKIMTVSTSKDSFLIGMVDDKELWRYNGDQAWRWIVQHIAALERLSDDRKFEVRTHEMPDLSSHVSVRCRKQRNRMQSFMHMASAAVINYAKRLHTGHIIYCDDEREYLPSFSWAEFRGMLQAKAEFNQIDFEHVTQKPDAEKPEAESDLEAD